ncbi:MAG TPA: OmpH family outer membrane protein [Burkholderiales bacterium]
MKAPSFASWTFATLLAVGGPALAQSSLGFVSLDRILRESPPAQRAQKKLEQEFSQRATELSKAAEQLKKMQENLERNAVTMPESERQKREREFGDLTREFQRKQREFNEDLGHRRKEEFDVVVALANQAVRQIAETEKLDVVFQNEQVVWANPRIDITEKVIKALEDSRAGK